MTAAHMARLDATSTELGVSQRKAQGAHYTPAALVEFLLCESLHDVERAPRDVLDPACGDGNFLVAAVIRLAADGTRSVAELLEHAIFGVDIDPVAVDLCRAALFALLPSDIERSARERVRRALREHIRCADAFTLDLASLSGRDGFDLVLGNPPFLNQLARATAATRERAALLARVTDGAVRRYADIAAAFLCVGLAATRTGGRLGFVMPQSFLASFDAKPARDAVLARASLRAAWTCNESLFDDAIVRVCTVVLERGNANREHRAATSEKMRCAFGVDFHACRSSGEVTRADPTWSHLFADGFSVPPCAWSWSASDTLESICTATADFRDEYYGLRGYIVERVEAIDAHFPKLLTTKHVDLAANSWGLTNARILGAFYRHPRVDRAALARDSALGGWMSKRLTSKVLVATQTRVIEALVDEDGGALPLVPLLSVSPREGVDVWMIAAAVASPLVAARAVALYSGSALSSGAIKLSAKQLLAMPLPRDERLWRTSAQEFKAASLSTTVAAREEHLVRYAEASLASHGLTHEDARAVLEFWNARRARSSPTHLAPKTQHAR